MKIAFNPSTVAALTTPPNNKDITFDLRGRNIFARGVKFYGTDTNTWRDIKINNVSIGSYTLDLRNGSNTTLTNTNGVVTINSTWRPVVDNLTSDSTTSSLSAKQGKVLKALIDGKSNSDHNHDGRYLRLSGQDTMQGNLYLHSHGISYIGKGLGDKSGADFTEANIVIRSQWGISFKSYDDIVRTYIDTRTGNIGTKGVLNAAGAVIQGRVYNSGDDEGIIINLSSSGYAGLILGTHNGERSVFYFRQGHPFWRYNTGYTNLDIYHPKKSGTIALTSDIPDKNSWNYDDRYLRLTGGWMLGDINFGGDNKILWMHNTDSAYISFKNDGDQDANSYMNFVTSGNGNEYFRWSYSSDSTNTEWMALKSDGLRVRGTKVSLEGHSHNDLYYTESEVNSLLDAKLNRQNLSYGNWNPRNHHLAAVYCCNGGNLSISELGDQIHVSIDGYFWQDEGQYRVLDTSDVLSLKNDLTVHQYLSNTDVAWYPLVWGGNSHRNTSDSTGAVYKSYDILSWQNSSQTLRATNIQTNNIKNLSIGGGIYWNPNVESASDGTDAASITVVKSGITGGTTLVLSQMNDTEDTIQFKTDAAARLYHNSYPILTTQNTYVRNNKGYINGVEITQVNNADTLDGIYYTKFLRQEVYPNNTENDFNTFSNMTLSGRADPTTGASLKNAPWSGSGPIGGYGVLTYLFRGEGYGTQMAWGYGENRIYIRNKFWGGDGVGIVWRTSWDALALTSDIPTVTNYYWADVKISASPSTNTSPTVSNLTATNSIRMSNIMLEHTDEINNRVNGGIYLNYRNSGNVSLCYGGGNVGIGITTSSYKLDVNGQMRASGFHHASVNSDNYMLLAGGGYSLLKTLIFTGKEFTYTDSSHYNLRFHKLSSLCNNLVWVDGHVSGPVNTLFTIADEVRPYCYNNDYSLVTIYNNCIRVDAQGRVALAVGSTTLRIGFFYTGKA